METLEKNTKQEHEPASKEEPAIEIRHLQKSFGNNVVLKDFNLSIYPGENMVVMGKSGIGKTVLIKCIIGLMEPDAGDLIVLGKDISKLSKRELNDLRMRIGFVFQSSALYDSMTVRENLEFTLLRSKHKKIENIDKQVRSALASVGLEKAIDQMPAELSGGMRKRIGIARSLILKPEIVLYDEPTTGLDPITSSEISKLIKDLQEENKTTGVIITHDVDLAREAATRIVFLIDGIAYLEGTFEEVSKTNDPKVKPFFAR
jgi:phospholipid/cholesterol/gamma-HCH transport system ATP-binding protein